jgi:N-hydroxyarylamine O-acetyltransferase
MGLRAIARWRATVPGGRSGSIMGEWLVERRGPTDATDGRVTSPDWQRQYGFNLAQVAPIDLELSNH